MGETLQSTDVSGNGSCNGRVSFLVQGVAFGPYPTPPGPAGFAEQGFVNLYPGYFSADFFISSIFGPVSGGKSADSGSGTVTCNPVVLSTGELGFQVIGQFEAQYQASVAATNCQLKGTANVDFVFILDSRGNITPQQSFFKEFTLTSNTCAPPVGPPAFVMLQPANAFNPVGTSHTVTATVTDLTGHPVPGTTVFFSVTGADSITGECSTDSTGMCSFTYQGPQLPGADDITGCAGGSPNAPPCGDATKIWTVPASTPGQVTGGGQIQFPQMPPSDEVSFGFNAQSDGTTTKGNCNVIDHDKGVHIKCDNVQALVVVGPHATFFGQADQDGVTTNYRIDVDDLADPGAGMDMFKIQTDHGYFAGGFLTAGNIQIHK